MNRSSRTFATIAMAADVSRKFGSAFEFSAVIAIIMVLTLLVYRNVETYIVQSGIAEAFTVTSTLKAEMVAYRAQHGYWPSHESVLHAPAVREISGLGRYVDRLEVRDDGVISVLFRDENPTPGLEGRRLDMQPALAGSAPGSPVFWLCVDHRASGDSVAAPMGEIYLDASQIPTACREP